MLKKIAPHLKQPSTRIGNLWLLEDGPQRFLIDTGHALERPSLLAELFMAGIRMPGDLTAILLTNRHGEHAGNAAWMRKRFGARVVCHENDQAVLSGKVTAPPLVGGPGGANPVKRLLSAYEDAVPALCEVDETYTEGAWKWGFQVIPVPGHTEGSVLLYHERTRTLFTGDAILVGPPLLQLSSIPGARKATEKLKATLASLTDRVPLLRDLASDPEDPKALRLVDPAFSQDAPSCHLAVRRFLKHAPAIDYLCPGHGPALGIDDQIVTRLARLQREM